MRVQHVIRWRQHWVFLLTCHCKHACLHLLPVKRLTQIWRMQSHMRTAYRESVTTACSLLVSFREVLLTMSLCSADFVKNAVSPTAAAAAVLRCKLHRQNRWSDPSTHMPAV
jgi:hypothetical protein